MLYASGRVGLFDRYRVPYVVTARGPSNLLSIGRADGTGPRLLALRASPGERERFYRFEGAVLYVALADDPTLSDSLQESGYTWEEEWPITDLADARRASVFCARDGSVFLPFDIDAALESFLRESYLAARRGRPCACADAWRVLPSSAIHSTIGPAENAPSIPAPSGARDVSSLADRDILASPRGTPARSRSTGGGRAVAVDLTLARAVRLGSRSDSRRRAEARIRAHLDCPLGRKAL